MDVPIYGQMPIYGHAVMEEVFVSPQVGGSNDCGGGYAEEPQQQRNQVCIGQQPPFIAAFVPGILAAIGYMITIAIYARLKPQEMGTMAPMPMKDRIAATVIARRPAVSEEER